MVTFWTILKNGTLQFKTTVSSFRAAIEKNWATFESNIWLHWSSPLPLFCFDFHLALKWTPKGWWRNCILSVHEILIKKCWNQTFSKRKNKNYKGYFVWPKLHNYNPGLFLSFLNGTSSASRPGLPAKASCFYFCSELVVHLIKLNDSKLGL